MLFPVKNRSIVKHLLCRNSSGSPAFFHARFQARLCNLRMGRPRYVNTKSLCKPRRDSITRWATAFNTTTRSVLVLVTSAGRMKTEIFDSGISTSQSQRSRQIS
ncbi:MAG: hypothetical protein WD078_01730, partial [Woeseia sp.]